MHWDQTLKADVWTMKDFFAEMEELNKYRQHPDILKGIGAKLEKRVELDRNERKDWKPSDMFNPFGPSDL